MRMILKDGREILMSLYGLKLLKYYIPSVSIEHQTSIVEGFDGPIFNGTRFSGRIITAKFMYKAFDYHDFKLFVAEINALFARKEYFYIIFGAEPGKRWKVRLAESYSPNELLRKVGELEIKFICENIFAESVPTTMDLKEWDVDKWQWGMGIDWDEDLAYSFSSNNFSVKNYGNVLIDPRQHDLEIILRGSFSYVTITNHTTGDSYQYNGSLNGNDTLILRGVQTLKNYVSDFKNTNKRLLTLAAGNNNISISGGTVHSIAFNFRFLYL
ncbi:distal tail protein Dit [Lysinibacillus pakistanensis]|uniref:Phage tail family protein n=1 Tax=Lysinibacillus pakistanensis TaxID=759811 RepID=A0ABX6DA33_9BACI|nr:phage tail family protein [Lysinibacillus pakistanensis]